MSALLDDPAYTPKHPPIGGRVPDVVAKWGAASQLRWFRRFWDDLSRSTLQAKALEPFYCQSEEHRGACCISCLQEQYDGYYYTDSCCCRAAKF